MALSRRLAKSSGNGQLVLIISPKLGIELDLGLHDAREEGVVVFSRKGRIAAEENEGNDTKGPHVNRRPVLPLLQDLEKQPGDGGDGGSR